MKAINRLLATLAISSAMVPGIADAAVWATPYGWVSNVCVHPSGAYMAFSNAYGYLGQPCTFKYFHSPVIYHGTWQ